jgi:cytochrome b
MTRLLIWDVPTRLFHWCLAASFGLAWLTSQSDAWLQVHLFAGYLSLALVIWRVLWGLVGEHYALFASFPLSVRQAWTYFLLTLGRRAPRHLGHNPAGALVIYAMLTLLLLLGASGVLVLGAEEQLGPLADWGNIASGSAIKEIHESLAILLLLLVLGHVAGVVVESVAHKENLARAMLTGFKRASALEPEAHPRLLTAAILLLAMLGFAIYWFGRGEQPGHTLVDNATWRAECESCHVNYHPSLLPARSWRRLLADQGRHFGTDLDLQASVVKTLEDYAVANAAERHQTEAAYKIDRSIAPDAVPQRVSATPYWVRKHREIASSQWQQANVKSRSNCEACHRDASRGLYEDTAIEVPASQTVSRKP